MTLISSVSGIRGTIGGTQGTNLSPLDIVGYVSAYARLLKSGSENPRVVLGRDGRSSGAMLNALVEGTLTAMGVDVLQAGLSTTPSIEMAVIREKANGGIILSASHNPMEWNALKLLNKKGEFISEEDGQKINAWNRESAHEFSPVEALGKVQILDNVIEKHIEDILNLPEVCVEEIRARQFKIAADCINSTAAIALPVLFKALNADFHLINEKMEGTFRHNPEPLPDHLAELMDLCKTGFDLGIAVDPDVDRLALVDELGNYIGEEYSLVVVADYMLSNKKGNTVSNLSSSYALRDLTVSRSGAYYSSAVGEVHVVKKMKEVNAIIGGEGNGGIIVPQLHYGRDALVGIALVLSHMAKSGRNLSQLKRAYPQYAMYKDKLQLDGRIDFRHLLEHLQNSFSEASFNNTDGLKIEFSNSWIHIRKSNTEPIVRIYTEAQNAEDAKKLAQEVISIIQAFKQ